jgi:hypothetical protein
MSDSTKDTLDHKAKVQAAMGKLINELLQRAATHDNSKLQEPEKSGYDALGAAMQGVEYGTPEYFAVIAASQLAVAHHYAYNRHHPEHHADGVDDMTLVDLLEMVCDWEAAAQRRDKHALEQAAALSTRFAIGGQLQRIILNTLEDLTK